MKHPFCVQTPQVKVDPWGLLSVFDLTTYALILASILVAVALFILLSWHSSLVSQAGLDKIAPTVPNGQGKFQILTESFS